VTTSLSPKDEVSLELMLMDPPAMLAAVARAVPPPGMAPPALPSTPPRPPQRTSPKVDAEDDTKMCQLAVLISKAEGIALVRFCIATHTNPLRTIYMPML
jgi:hypothetical protein